VAVGAELQARTGPGRALAVRGRPATPSWIAPAHAPKRRRSLPETPAGDPDPSDRAESSFVAWRVHRALEELPEREREVIALAYWSGLSQSEVAEFLGIPLGTVKTRTRAALSRLSDVLGDELT